MKVKLSYIFSVVALFALPLFLAAQTKPLSEKDQRKFDYYFFEAQNNKQIGRYNQALDGFLACYKIDPTNATVAFEIGRILLATRQPNEGEIYLERALANAPHNKFIAHELSTAYRKNGKPNKAIKVLENLIQQYPENVDYRFEVAQLYFSTENYKSCLEQLNQLEVLLGVSEEISRQKKDIYLLLDDEKGAEKELVKLCNAFPKNLEYKGNLAQFYSANDEPKKAEKIYNQMLAIDPNEPRAHLDLAILYKSQDKFAASYAHLEKAMASTSLDADKKIQVLYSFFQNSKNDTTMLEAAYKLLEICIEATPTEPKFYAMKGDFEMRDGAFKEARTSYRKATRLGANQLAIWSQLLLLDARINNPDTLAADAEVFIELYPNQPLGYLMAGAGYAQQKKLSKAISTFEEGVDFVVDNPELEAQFYISLADAYHQQKMHVKSDSYFDKALAIIPNDASVLNNYAYYLAVRGTKLEQALEMTRKCNTIAPNNGVFLDTYAWVLYRMGKYEEALEKIKLCNNAGGADSGEVLEHWGDILFMLGRKEEALEKWKEAATKPDASEALPRKIETKNLYE